MGGMPKKPEKKKKEAAGKVGAKKEKTTYMYLKYYCYILY